MDKHYQKVAYGSAILLVDSRCKTCETWDALFYFPEFDSIYAHSAVYLSDALSFLSNRNYDERQKKICICSMQNCSLDDYIRIIDQCKKLFDSGEMSEILLAWSLSPNFSKRHLIVRNYEKAHVKDLLDSLHRDRKVTAHLKELIESILSRKLWDNTKSIEGDVN